MIRSFKNRDTEQVFDGFRSRRIPVMIQRRAQRKLLILHAASTLQDVRVPPGNRLEKLVGYKEIYSIRINNQWRVCFVWRDSHAHDVEIVDYHS